MAATESAKTAGRGLRADALRNRQRIVAAARQIEEQGLDAPLDEVAQRAEVGAGTLYRRFPTREDLVEAAFEDELRKVAAIAEEAVHCEDPWTGFSTYVERLCAAPATDRGLSDLFTVRLPNSQVAAGLCDRQSEALAKLVRRAQEAGALRDDFVRTALGLRSLNAGAEYWVAVDAFGEAGVTSGEPVPAVWTPGDPNGPGI